MKPGGSLTPWLYLGGIMKGRATLAVILTLTTGCATVLGSKQHDFSFDSNPQHAQVLVDGNPVGTTPVTVNLSNTQTHTVTFKKDGYLDAGCVFVEGHWCGLGDS